MQPKATYVTTVFAVGMQPSCGFSFAEPVCLLGWTWSLLHVFYYILLFNIWVLSLLKVFLATSKCLVHSLFLALFMLCTCVTSNQAKNWSFLTYYIIFSTMRSSSTLSNSFFYDEEYYCARSKDLLERGHLSLRLAWSPLTVSLDLCSCKVCASITALTLGW